MQPTPFGPPAGDTGANSDIVLPSLGAPPLPPQFGVGAPDPLAAFRGYPEQYLGTQPAFVPETQTYDSSRSQAASEIAGDSSADVESSDEDLHLRSETVERASVHTANSTQVDGRSESRKRNTSSAASAARMKVVRAGKIVAKPARTPQQRSTAHSKAMTRLCKTAATASVRGQGAIAVVAVSEVGNITYFCTKDDFGSGWLDPRLQRWLSVMAGGSGDIAEAPAPASQFKHPRGRQPSHVPAGYTRAAKKLKTGQVDPVEAVGLLRNEACVPPVPCAPPDASQNLDANHHRADAGVQAQRVE